jgi:hypothetical protein
VFEGDFALSDLSIILFGDFDESFLFG